MVQASTRVWEHCCARELQFPTFPVGLSRGPFHCPALSSQTSVDPLLVQSHQLRFFACPFPPHAPSPAVPTPLTNSHTILPFLSALVGISLARSASGLGLPSSAWTPHWL